MISVILVSCNDANWSKEEQNTFLRTCFDEGGSKKYCKCFLVKIMKYCPIADEIEQIDYEQKVELAKYCE